MLAELPASVLRDELMRQVAGRLELSARRSSSGCSRARRGPSPAASAADGRRGRVARAPLPAISALDSGVRAERAFLALCIALPEAGAEALAAIDPDELLTSSVYRRAARHLAGPHRVTAVRPAARRRRARARRSPTSSPSPAAAGTVSAERLDHARLVLELLASTARSPARVRAGAAGIGELAREREHVREQLHGVVARLEQTV